MILVQCSYMFCATADRTGDLEEFDEPLSQSTRLPQIAGASLAAGSVSGPRLIPRGEEQSGAGQMGFSLFHEIARLGDPAVLSQVDLSPDLTGAPLAIHLFYSYTFYYFFCI